MQIFFHISFSLDCFSPFQKNGWYFTNLLPPTLLFLSCYVIILLLSLTITIFSSDWPRRFRQQRTGLLSSRLPLRSCAEYASNVDNVNIDQLRHFPRGTLRRERRLSRLSNVDDSSGGQHYPQSNGIARKRSSFVTFTPNQSSFCLPKLPKLPLTTAMLVSLEVYFPSAKKK